MLEQRFRYSKTKNGETKFTFDGVMTIGHKVAIGMVDLGGLGSVARVEGPHEVLLTAFDFLEKC